MTVLAKQTDHEFTLAIKQHKVILEAPCVMGVINLSPGSFYQAIPNLTDALKKADEMIAQGVSIIDVGAVATNPTINMQTDLPSIQTEMDAVVPFVEALAKRFDGIISVDTCEPAVMQAVVDVGASMINDQRALHENGALEMLAKLKVPVCLMHHFAQIRTPGSSSFQTLLAQVKLDLQRDVQRCLDAGINSDRIIIDPGFGAGNYGKCADENFYLLSHLNEFVASSYPVLVGFSRKTMFGELLGIPAQERLSASISAATVAALLGAAIIRAHDVKETVEAMNVVRRVKLFTPL